MKYHPSYDDAIKIHAICSDLGLPASDAKTLTYIHIKSQAKPEHFSEPAATEIIALKIMLGYDEFKVAWHATSGSPSDGAESLREVFDIHRQLTALDKHARAEFGLEFPFRYELENRLRLYQDKEFLERNLKTYREKILPGLPRYSRKEVDLSFEKHRENLASVEQKLRNIIDPA